MQKRCLHLFSNTINLRASAFFCCIKINRLIFKQSYGATALLMWKNLSVGILSLLLGAATLFFMPQLVSGETLKAISDPYSPGFFPIVISVLLIICGGVVIATVAVGRSPEIRGDGTIESPLRLTSTALIIVAYTVAMQWVGMLIASILLIAGMAYIFGYRPHWIIAGSAIVVPVFVHVLFERMLYVLLPQSQVFQ